MKRKRVTVDAYPDSPFRYVDHDAVICIKVLPDTTTLVTAAGQGRRVLLAPDVEGARRLAFNLGNILLADGDRSDNGNPGRMHRVPNSPAMLSRRTDFHRPLVLATGAGTETILNANCCSAVYVACLRNLQATAKTVAERCHRVAVLAACSYRQLVCEDLMAAARVAAELCSLGFGAEDDRTESLMSRWADASLSLIRLGSTAERLRRTEQAEDVDFVLDHIDDLPVAVQCIDGEIMAAPRVEPAAAKERALNFARHPASSVPVELGIAIHAAADHHGH